MNERTIAIIRLAAGNVGWYDRLTSIHLTISNPTAEVEAGMNLANIKKAVKCKTVNILSGDLNGEPLLAQTLEEPVIKEDVAQETSQIVEETPQVVEEVIEIVEETPQVMSLQPEETESEDVKKPKKPKTKK